MIFDAIDWILRQCIDAAIGCGWCGPWSDFRDHRIEAVTIHANGDVQIEWGSV